MKIRRGPPSKNGNRIFKLFALLFQQSGLRTRGIQQRFFLGHVQARGHSALVPRVDQIQPLLQCVHRAQQQCDFRVQLAQAEIIRRQFRGQDQAHVLKVRRIGL